MINIPLYSPGELVRIEILRYDNPDGIHPIEAQWRDLAKKLLAHTEELQKLMVSYNGLVSDYQKRNNNLPDFKPFKFPGKFKDPNIPEQTSGMDEGEV